MCHCPSTPRFTSSSPISWPRRKCACIVHAWLIRNKLPTSSRRSLRCRPMPSYDALNFDPPAPTAQVILRDPHGGAMVSDVLLLLDTGADTTLLPRTAVERLGVSPL